MATKRQAPPSGEQVAAEALTWVGTRFLWGQATKGQGCDCKGLLAGVASELGRPEAASLYGLNVTYRGDRPVPTALLREGLAALFDRVAPGDPHQAGDVLLLKLNGAAQHLAIVSLDVGRAIHAQLAPSARVKETNLELLLKACPLHSAWRWRELEADKPRRKKAKRATA